MATSRITTGTATVASTTTALDTTTSEVAIVIRIATITKTSLAKIAFLMGTSKHATAIPRL